MHFVCGFLCCVSDGLTTDAGAGDTKDFGKQGGIDTVSVCSSRGSSDEQHSKTNKAHGFVVLKAVT